MASAGSIVFRRSTFWCMLIAVSLTAPPVRADVIQEGGITVRRFRDFYHILELECSGEVLDAGTDLFSMTLYIVPEETRAAFYQESASMDKMSTISKNQLIAVVNLKSGECLTSNQFSSCLVNRQDSRQTKLRTLLIGLEEGQKIMYGCNLTVLIGGTHGKVITWAREISGEGK